MLIALRTRISCMAGNLKFRCMKLMNGTFLLTESLKPSSCSRWISSHGGVFIIWISPFSSAATRVAGSCNGRMMMRSSFAGVPQ